MSSPRARRGSDIARIVLTIREKKARLKELEREARELRSQLTAARDAVGGPPIRGRRSGATRGTPRPVWPSSIAGRAATALRQAGRPLRIEELLRAIERISGDKIAQATLVGQLARDVRKGRLFRRTAPNVFALAEGTSRRRGR